MDGLFVSKIMQKVHNWHYNFLAMKLNWKIDNTLVVVSGFTNIIRPLCFKKLFYFFLCKSLTKN